VFGGPKNTMPESMRAQFVSPAYQPKPDLPCFQAMLRGVEEPGL